MVQTGKQTADLSKNFEEKRCHKHWVLIQLHKLYFSKDTTFYTKWQNSLNMGFKCACYNINV